MTQPSLFDVGVYTITRTRNFKRRAVNGFVVFSTPAPFETYYVRTLPELVSLFDRDPASIWGTVFVECTCGARTACLGHQIAKPKPKPIDSGPLPSLS